MNPRTCDLRIFITNDHGVTSYYRLKPLRGADLGQSVAAFKVVNSCKDPSPVYVVRLAIDGQATCDCPQHNFAGECKHADALLAAGVLPSALVGLLLSRSQLLDKAEAELAAVSARAVQLQSGLAAVQSAGPKRRRGARQAKAA